MLFLLEWFLILLGVLGVVLTVGVGIFKQILQPLWRGQKIFPHLRDPVVRIRDDSERRVAQAEARLEQAKADAKIRAIDAEANAIAYRVNSGEIEDEITRNNNRRAQELEDEAARIRNSVVNLNPIPDLSTDPEREEKSKRERTRG